MELSKSLNTVTPESASSSFFGSPSEPIYTENKHILSAELLQDALMLLASKNETALSAIQKSTMDKAREKCMEFKSGYPILFLFELCKHFKLSPEVQYRATELFHRFMTNHIIELHQVAISVSVITRLLGTLQLILVLWAKPNC